MFALVSELPGVHSVSAQPRKLPWPLDAQIAPTSSFCEFRPFRYHAGLDFSTGGRTGVPIIAVGNGHVWRIRVSPYGYGKVLYLRLEDGRTAVYAHLSKFTDAVEELVLRDQIERQEYTVDLFPTPGQVRVRRGEVVAWSGASGVGMPHLHFEIRDEQNRPLNPMANGLALADTVPPTMVSLALIPLEADARAQESLEPLIVPLAYYDSLWTSTRRPLLWGRIGVALMVFDRTPQGRYRLSVYGTTLSVDGQEVFRRRYDRVSLQNQHLSVFDRNFSLLALGAGRYYNLFLSPGNSLPFYDDLPVGAGVLACGQRPVGESESYLGPGIHELAFTATDFSGVAAQGKLSFVVGRAPGLVEFLTADSAGGPVLHVSLRDSSNGVRLTASASNGRNADWRLLEPLPSDALGEARRPRLSVRLRSDSPFVRVVAEDTLGNRVAKVTSADELDEPPKLRLAQTWGRDWLSVDIRASRPLKRTPTITAEWPEEVMVKFEPTEVSPGLYETDIVPEPSWPKNYRVRVLSGGGRPTIVTQWVGERGIPGSCEFVPDRDSLSALYRGVIGFTDAFPESVLVHLTAAEFDTILSVKGKLLGPYGGEYSRPDLSAAVEFGRGVIPEPMFVRIRLDSLRRFRELEPIGPAYVFEPQVHAFAGQATLLVALPDTMDLTGVALYGVSSKEATCLAVPEESFDHTLRARVPSLYTVGVYRDTVPPSIQITSPRPGTIVRVRRPLIVASLRDHGAGFAHTDDAMEMRLDDSWVPAEYDPEEGTLTFQPAAPLSTGSHTVTVHARDQVGNERTATLAFTVE